MTTLTSKDLSNCCKCSECASVRAAFAMKEPTDIEAAQALKRVTDSQDCYERRKVLAHYKTAFSKSLGPEIAETIMSQFERLRGEVKDAKYAATDEHLRHRETITALANSRAEQGELARVLKYIALKKTLALPDAVTELTELVDELLVGAHRQLAAREEAQTARQPSINSPELFGGTSFSGWRVMNPSEANEALRQFFQRTNTPVMTPISRPDFDKYVEDQKELQYLHNDKVFRAIEALDELIEKSQGILDSTDKRLVLNKLHEIRIYFEEGI